MPEDLAGQVAIVTGGGRGIGRAIAESLATAGAVVVVAGRSESTLLDAVAAIEAAGGRALAVATDITDRASVARMAQVVTERLGPVDLFIANAGVIDPMGPLLETDPDEWWRCFEVNVRGTATCIRAVLPAMVARRSGRVIALFGGSNTAMPNHTAYGSSKAAVLRLVENLGAEMEPHNVQVFALNPGPVETDMFRDILAYRERSDDSAPAPKYMPAAWSGNACVFLASGQGDALSGRLVLVWEDYAQTAARIDDLRRDQLYVLRFRTLPRLPEGGNSA